MLQSTRHGLDDNNAGLMGKDECAHWDQNELGTFISFVVWSSIPAPSGPASQTAGAYQYHTKEGP